MLLKTHPTTPKEYLTQRHGVHKEKMMMFKTQHTTPKSISHTETRSAQRKNFIVFPTPLQIILTRLYKEIICINLKNKLRRVVVGFVSSVALCEVIFLEG